MDNREVAIEFTRCFCGGDVDGLARLLVDDLRFKGPYHQFGSSAAYLAAVRADPPEESSYRVHSVTEGQEEVSVYWEYQKRDGALTLAQLFGFRDGLISEILLVFDARESG